MPFDKKPEGLGKKMEYEFLVLVRRTLGRGCL